MIVVQLHHAHAAPVAAGHPWVYSQAVAKLGGEPRDGDEVLVEDPFGKALGKGLWSAESAIAVRMLARDPRSVIDADFFLKRVRAAVRLRRMLGLPSAETTGFRLIYAEGDGLSGLIADVYGDVIVLQFLTAGMAQRRAWIVEALRQELAPHAVVALSTPTRGTDSPLSLEALWGTPPDTLRFRERGFQFCLPLGGTQKTGYYFDQREQRGWIEAWAHDREVLDACSYIGGFALAAARGGARSVLALDSSEPALRLGAQHARDNGLDQRITQERADVRGELEALRRAGRTFDMVLFDPPKLVPTVKHLERGRRAYRKLNAHAIALTRPEGVLVTCSCSAAMSETDFLRMLSLASGDVGRELCVLRVGKQGPDHPLLPGFGEGSYLKTVMAIVR